MSDQDATARRAELEDAVAAAEEDQRQIRGLARGAGERVAQLREQLAGRPTAEFGDDGAAKPKSQAAVLHRELQTAEHPPVAWSRREQDAANRVAAARRAVEHFTASNIEGLVLDLKPGRDAEDQRIIDTIEQLDAMLVDRLKFAQQIAGLLAPVPGLNAVTEVPSGDDIDQLRKTLREFLATGLRPALPVSICTPEGKTPPRVKTASGQWIGVQHASDIDQHRQRKRDEQDERDRQPRRRVPVHPPQPQPSGRSPLDETLSALLGD